MTAVQADFVNYKRVATRKVVQLIFEIPEEVVQLALQALGLPGTIEGGNWCGIARMVPEAERPPAEEPLSPAKEFWDRYDNGEQRAAE